MSQAMFETTTNNDVEVIISDFINNSVKVNEYLYETSGSSITEGHSKIIKGINYSKRHIVQNDEDVEGFIFFTRPKLNLSTPSLKMDRFFY